MSGALSCAGPKPLFIPFRIKLLSAFLALSALVLVSTLLIANWRQTADIQSGVKLQLGVARDVFRETLRMRERQLAVASRLLAGDFAFKQALATRDAATIASNARSLKERIGADTVWIADDEGRLYADTSGLLRRGADISKMRAVHGALDRGQGAEIEASGPDVYQFAAVPVNAPDLIGVLVTGFRVGDSLAALIGKQTRASVSFANEAGIFASTLDAPRRAVLQAERSRLPLDAPTLIGPPGRQDLAVAVRVAGGVTAYLQRSWDDALEPLRRLRTLLYGLGLLALALTVVLGYGIADSVTSSVSELAEATGRLAGGDYGARVQVRTRDEIGQLGDAFNTMVVGLQEREKIRSVLRKAVSKEIADELLKRGEINLGGEERLISVLFCDIRSFTTISEKLDAPRLVSELNEYFGRMTKAIEEHRGVIDKYVGDAIMALFGAPLDSPMDAANAQRSALAMRKALGILNADRAARGLVALDIGIGVNTGQAVAGMLGSENRWSYTVIGDAVNLASRLEGLTKHYGCPILVTAETRERGGEGFLHRSVDLVRVKGRSKPVEVFELLGFGEQAPPWLSKWESAAAVYRSGDLAGAGRLFTEVAAAKPGDGPAAEFLGRLASLPAKAAPGWDPAYTALEK